MNPENTKLQAPRQRTSPAVWLGQEAHAGCPSACKVDDSAPDQDGLDDQVLAFDGSGNLTHRYLHGPEVDQLFADESGGVALSP